MVECLVAEEEWMGALEGLARWSPPPRRLVVVVPHPDDETLGAGGLIATQCKLGLPISVVAVTDGEAAYSDFAGLGEMRAAEQQSALQTLGVEKNHIIRLRLPDSGLADCEKSIEASLMPFITSNALLLAPWSGDWHPDHEVCGRVAAHVARISGVELISYVFWTWHQGDIAALTNKNLRRFDLSDEIRSIKETALQCHRSQLYRQTGPPILPPALLVPARRTFETFIVHD